MEVGNIISWVGNQLEEAQRLEPAPPVFTPRPPYQPRPTSTVPPSTPGYTSESSTAQNVPPTPPSMGPPNPPDGPYQQTCNRQCSRIFSQVCGSNGRTYNNRCLLELDACERATSIQVVREGSCSSTTEESPPTTTQQPIYPPVPENPTTPENTFGIVVCKRTEFTCSLDQRCISYIQRCDGTPHCSDGQARNSVVDDPYLIIFIGWDLS